MPRLPRLTALARPTDHSFRARRSPSRCPDRRRRVPLDDAGHARPEPGHRQAAPDRRAQRPQRHDAAAGGRTARGQSATAGAAAHHRLQRVAHDERRSGARRTTKVDSTLDALLGPAGAGAALGHDWRGRNERRGVAGNAIDPAIRAKLVEFRAHLDQFEDVASGRRGAAARRARAAAAAGTPIHAAASPAAPAAIDDRPDSPPAAVRRTGASRSGGRRRRARCAAPRRSRRGDPRRPGRGPESRDRRGRRRRRLDRNRQRVDEDDDHGTERHAQRRTARSDHDAPQGHQAAARTK